MPPPKRQARDVAASRTHPSTILSPKSNNSRTMHQSPIHQHLRPSSKPVARPVSPLKPTSSPFKSAAVAASAGLANLVAGKSAKPSTIISRTNSKTVKAPPKATRVLPPRTVSVTSNMSASSGTSTGTIIRKVGAAIKGSVAPRKTAASTTKAAAAKKTAAAKTKVDVAKSEVTAGGRTLRKRL